MNIAIIGSGIGGLAAAIRLSVKGHNVKVYEKNNQPGGKISELRMEGYRFDTGPSLFTLPNLVDELYELCGENSNADLPYLLLENNCKYFFSDQTEFNFYHNKKLLRKEIEIKTNENAETILHRLKQSEEMYNVSAPVFIFNSLRKYSNFTTAPYRKMLLKVLKLRANLTMHNANKHDFKDPNMVQLFDRYATYNGSNPYKAPATLNMIAHLENNIGAYFPLNGMYSIVNGLFQLAEKKGVKFEFNSLVEEIIVQNKIAIGIKTSKKVESYDLIVSDCDSKYLSTNMLRHPHQNRINKSEPSSSALIFYWGINKVFESLEMHNILFSNDYKQEFDHIFNHHTLSEEPTVYIFISSKIVKSDAPAGCENWFVMINAPSNNEQNWEEFIKAARKNIVNKINKTLRTDIEKHIICEHIASPLTIEKNTLSPNGALYGNSSNSMFAAFMRHPNWFSDIKNLYFVGGSVHPGGGIPLCLASAKIVDQEIPLAYEN